jgi:hypothetical protein
MDWYSLWVCSAGSTGEEHQPRPIECTPYTHTHGQPSSCTLGVHSTPSMFEPVYTRRTLGKTTYRQKPALAGARRQLWRWLETALGADSRRSESWPATQDHSEVRNRSWGILGAKSGTSLWSHHLDLAGRDEQFQNVIRRSLTQQSAQSSLRSCFTLS